MGLDENLTQL